MRPMKKPDVAQYTKWLQLCADEIKERAGEIVGDTKDITELKVTIEMSYNTIPTINVNKTIFSKLTVEEYVKEKYR